MAEEQETKKKKNKKINKMTLTEIEAALTKCEEHMGNLTGKYPRVLLARKEELSAEPS